MDKDSCIIQVKTDNIYKHIAQDVASRFDTSSFEIERLLPLGKNEKK